MEQKGSLVQEQQVQEVQEAQEVSCQHHWVIGYPEGPISRGICRKCGAQREFKNSFENTMREDNMWSHDLATGAGDLDLEAIVQE